MFSWLAVDTDLLVFSTWVVADTEVGDGSVASRLSSKVLIADWADTLRLTGLFVLSALLVTNTITDADWSVSSILAGTLVFTWVVTFAGIDVIFTGSAGLTGRAATDWSAIYHVTDFTF